MIQFNGANGFEQNSVVMFINNSVLARRERTGNHSFLVLDVATCVVGHVNKYNGLWKL